MRPDRCRRIVGDLDRDGFTAQTWLTERSNLGGLPLRGEDVVLRVPADIAVPSFAIGHVDLLPQAELSLPRQFAGGPITREDGLMLMGEMSPAFPPALRDLGPRVRELGEWVAAQPGSVTLLLSAEPRTSREADGCLQLARDVAARLSEPGTPSGPDMQAD